VQLRKVEHPFGKSFHWACNDSLGDEGESYAHKLDQVGVEVNTTRYLRQIHDFGLLNALHNIPSTQESLRQASQALKKYLNQ